MAETIDDSLRAAAAAGIVTEAQAASVLALHHARAGRREGMPAEDEPFEFFRGFSEIFVSVGLVILFSGVGLLVTLLSGFGALVTVPAVGAALAWYMAGYFTIRRRMNLPSMVLALAFGGGVFLSVSILLNWSGASPRGVLTWAAVAGMAAMAAFYGRFRLPFAMFVTGLFGLVLTYTLTASAQSMLNLGRAEFGGLFDLRNSPEFALATLGFGLAAFVAAMSFDLRDPHRLGRHSATAFWLHLMAAPALVNTAAMTLYNIGTTTGMIATAAALAAITALALVIDRRSFLTAGIAYLAALIVWAVQGDGAVSARQWAAILIGLGAVLTAIGTWWVALRAALMRALPDFPGKRRLPPYAE